MNLRRLAAVAAATIGISGAVLVAPVNAVTFDILTANGFISRGDVISHPALGKDALAVKPGISFSKDGAHWEQWCEKTTGAYQRKTFQQGLSNVNFYTTTRQAPGNDNITGYLMTSLGGSVTQPSTLCPTSWQPYNYDTVRLVSGRNLPPMLWYRNGIYNGSWSYDFNTLAWVIS